MWQYTVIRKQRRDHCYQPHPYGLNLPCTCSPILMGHHCLSLPLQFISTFFTFCYSYDSGCVNQSTESLAKFLLEEGWKRTEMLWSSLVPKKLTRCIFKNQLVLFSNIQYNNIYMISKRIFNKFYHANVIFLDCLRVINFLSKFQLLWLAVKLDLMIFWFFQYVNVLKSLWKMNYNQL